MTEEKVKPAAKKVAPKKPVAKAVTAKAPVKAAPKAKDASKTKEAAPTYKYGVETLAEGLGIKPASVRVGLRKLNVPKAQGNVYGWNTMAEVEKIKSDLKSKKAA